MRARSYQQATVHRLLIALAASVALHWLLMSGPAWQLPSLKDRLPQRLEARLEPLPPKAVAHTANKEAAPSRPRHTETPKPEVTPPAAQPASETPAPAPRPVPAAETQAAPSATAEEKPQPPKPQPGEQLPNQAEILFALHKGENGLSVGRVLHTWQRKGEHYSLSSVTEATGVFSLLKPGKLVQTSEGNLTEQGLQPTAFWVQRGQSTDTTEFAQFDWRNGNLKIGTYQEARTVDLPAGTQDLLSFLYQFAFAPPSGGTLSLYITNGRKLDTYDYDVVGEEVLALPFGKVKALHLTKQHAANEDGTDIWLSAEHRYFPVKIRQTDRKGDVAEQVAKEIHLSFGSQDKEDTH